MKKFFVKAAFIMSAITMTLGMTSCNEETFKVLTGILDQILAGQGTSVTFKGTMKARVMKYNGTEQTYVYLNPTGAFTTYNNVECPMTIGNNAASLSLPEFTADNTTASAVTLKKLSLSTSTTGSSFSVNESATEGESQLTVGTNTYSLTGVYVDKSMITADNKITYNIQLYYGNDYVVDIEYSGEAPLQEV